MLRRSPVSGPRNWSSHHMTIQTACVIGAGRVGTTIAARLRERGIPVTVTGRSLEVGTADLVLLCVPDAAIAPVAAALPAGPWIAHTSGATPVSALAPHARRFAVHPLQTFARDGGAAQLDGAYAAIGGETPEALARARHLATLLGLQPFPLADIDRAAYHAGACVAANYLVTLQRAAAQLLASAGAPAAALDPLLHRTIDNGYQLTGPIARGDWATVDAHLAAIAERAPGLDTLYRTLADATVELAVPA